MDIGLGSTVCQGERWPSGPATILTRTML